VGRKSKERSGTLNWKNYYKNIKMLGESWKINKIMRFIKLKSNLKMDVILFNLIFKATINTTKMMNSSKMIGESLMQTGKNKNI
jgi:hypothetical protein